LKLIIEALLFASDRPLTARDLRACLPDASVSEIKEALGILKYEYDAMGRSFLLKEIAGGFQFRSHVEYGPYILRMLETSPTRLSRAAMETLAIVAYKQPMLRHEIERIRGVDVGGIMRTLLEKGLIRIVGRKDLPGRPLIYGTTKRFLEVFDLRDIKELPKLKEIENLGTEEFETPSGEEDADPKAADAETAEQPADEASAPEEAEPASTAQDPAAGGTEPSPPAEGSASTEPEPAPAARGDEPTPAD
jgi:segregation and condensation protein B